MKLTKEIKSIVKNLKKEQKEMENMAWRASEVVRNYMGSYYEQKFLKMEKFKSEKLNKLLKKYNTNCVYGIPKNILKREWRIPILKKLYPFWYKMRRDRSRDFRCRRNVIYDYAILFAYLHYFYGGFIEEIEKRWREKNSIG